MTDPSAMERLAAKLASADLDDEEASLLVELLRGDSEVEGFAQQPRAGLFGSEGNDRFLQNGPMNKSKWIDVLSLSLEIEQTAN